MPKLTLRVFPNTDSLTTALSDHIADLIRSVTAQRGRFSIALAGGNTPRVVYQALAANYSSELPWNRVHLFWGDERYVPHDDPSSNYRMAHESLISKIDIPQANVHPIPTHFADPDEAARDYEQTLRKFSQSGPSFDLIML